MSTPMTLPDLRSFVDGAFVASRGDVDQVVDPATGTLIASVERGGSGDVDRAVAAARGAFDAWSATTPRHRSRALLRLADRVDDDAEQLARLESLNCGKPLLAAREEIAEISDCLRFFASAARCLPGTASTEYVEGHTSVIRREAAGVCAQIAPWNYPLLMAAWKIGPALAAGCTVVLKPAETTPVTTARLAELAADLFPAGVLNVLPGDRATGRLLAGHPGVDLVSVTGSTEAGRSVAAAGASTVKRLHLELGGKAPVVIFEDADLEPALDRIVGAALYNAGQDCTAATRVLVAAPLHDLVVEGLARRARAQVLGDPQDPSTELGPVNSLLQHERVLGLVDDRPAHADVVTGGGASGPAGYFVQPTVITGLQQQDDLVQREIFGPVITVQAFTDEADAVAKANGTPYGLASSIWTSDVKRALRVSRVLRFGCVWVNTHQVLAAEMPHGGYKQSGYGKDLSLYAVEDYTELKHVMFAD